MLRFNEPNGDDTSEPSRPVMSFTLSLSSGLIVELESRISVLRRKREGGGVVVFGSSRKKRVPLVGDIGFPVESWVSRRRAGGRAELGDEALKVLACEIEDLRPVTGPAFSLEALDGGGLSGELTVVVNSCVHD